MLAYRSQELLTLLIACSRNSFGNDQTQAIRKAGFKPTALTLEDMPDPYDLDATDDALDDVDWFSEAGSKLCNSSKETVATLCKYERGNIVVYVTDDFRLAQDVINNRTLYAVFIEQDIANSPTAHGGTELALMILREKEHTKVFAAGWQNFNLAKEVMSQMPEMANMPNKALRLVALKEPLGECFLPLANAMLEKIRNCRVLKEAAAANTHP